MYLEGQSKSYEAKAREAGNPKVIDAPCYLHPVHTAYMMLMKSLAQDPLLPTNGNNVLFTFLVDLHAFLKHSTARREDILAVREELAERLQDQFEEPFSTFFLCPVEFRWLEAQQVIERVL